MLKIVFGVADLLAAATFTGFKLNYNPSFVIFPLILFAVYLAIKGIVFLVDFASIIDILTAVLFFLNALGWGFFLDWVVVLWLVQKGIYSLMAR